MYPKVIFSHPVFCGERAHWNFGKVAVILSVILTVSCSTERSFSVLGRPKINLSSTMGQDRLSHLALLCIERAYVRRGDNQKVTDRLSSEEGRPKFFSQPIFRPKIIGYFFSEYCRKK